MANQGKLAVIALIVLLIAALAAAGLGFSALQQEKQTNARLTKDLMVLEDEKKTAENKIKELTRSLNETRDNLKDSETRIVSITGELDNEKKAKNEAVGEVGRLKNELEQVKNTKSQLEVKLKEGEINLNKAREELNAIKTVKESLDQKVKDLEAKTESVQLDKIVISGQPKKTVEPEVKALPSPTETVEENKVEKLAALTSEVKKEGKVLVVNAEYDFIVVNLGNKDGVSVGDVLNINRKNKEIGQAKIEEVRDTMSVAIPLSEGLMKQVKEEDMATVSSNK